MIARFTFLFFLIFGTLFSFDHSHKDFDSLLKKHVSNGFVDYKGFQIDKNIFDNYLTNLSNVSQSEFDKFTKQEKISFLINAYNAFTIQLILDNYPVVSIKKIGGLFKSPWKIDFFTLLGKKRTLDWIEHENLRVNFNEPRIHFAIVCASIGCPPIQSKAFTPNNLEELLESCKTNFLQDKSKNSYDSTKNKLFLSSIFKWFEKDFTKNQSLIEYVNPSFNNMIQPDAKIEYNDYNWNLNDKNNTRKKSFSE
jgi:hypothetical protein